MRQREPLEFTLPGLILCEGVGDKLFIEKLISTREITPTCLVLCCDDVQQTPGSSAFEKSLIELQKPTSWDQVKGLMIVGDKDEDQSAARENIQTQIDNAKFEDADRTSIRESWGDVAHEVFLIPTTQATGNLETVLWPVMLSLHPHLGEPIELLALANPVNTWPDVKKSKMRTQVISACTCKVRPQGGFALHCKVDPPYGAAYFLDSAFDSIAEELSAFSAKVATL